MLGHRWKSHFLEWASLFSGKYFAMLAIYADETGTGGVPMTGEEPAPGVYGFLATPEDWEDFRVKWKASLEKCDAPYFHFRELDPNFQKRHPDNHFSKWDKDRKDDFIYEMAIVASRGPIPVGGNVSQKLTVGPNPNNFQKAKLYRKMFYAFFEDFKLTMNDYFPKETDKVSFFFSDNKDDEWIKILSQIIKDARHHNPRIGTYTPINPYDQTDDKGIPCQAADLFAYVSRAPVWDRCRAGRPPRFHGHRCQYRPPGDEEWGVERELFALSFDGEGP